jgi:hypothetical protein
MIEQKLINGEIKLMRAKLGNIEKNSEKRAGECSKTTDCQERNNVLNRWNDILLEGYEGIDAFLQRIETTTNALVERHSLLTQELKELQKTKSKEDVASARIKVLEAELGKFKIKGDPAVEEKEELPGDSEEAEHIFLEEELGDIKVEGSDTDNPILTGFTENAEKVTQYLDATGKVVKQVVGPSKPTRPKKTKEPEEETEEDDVDINDEPVDAGG